MSGDVHTQRWSALAMSLIFLSFALSIHVIFCTPEVNAFPARYDAWCSLRAKHKSAVHISHLTRVVRLLCVFVIVPTPL